MKKFVAMTVALFCILLLLPMMAHADQAVQIYLNGKKLQPEVAPRVIHNHTFVPIRIIAEHLGAEVTWNKLEQKVKIAKKHKDIELIVDSADVLVNGAKSQLPAAPMIIGGTTMIPLRSIAEQLDVKLTWDMLTQSIYLYKREEVVSSSAMAASMKPPTVKAGEESHMDTAKEGAAALSVDEMYIEEPHGGLPGSGAQAEAGDTLSVIQSIQLNGDQIVIQGAGEITPSVFYLPNPDRIVLDLPYSEIGAGGLSESTLQHGEIAVNHPLVQHIRYAQFANNPSTVRVVIDLKQQVQYEVVQNKQTDQLVLMFNTAKYKVVIDPGHGGKDPGAVSKDGYFEKDFNLSLSTKVAELLAKEPQILSYMTRTSDIFIPLDERVKSAKSLAADMFISIHGNNLEREAIRGTETYYARPESKALAEVMHQYVLNATGFPDRNMRHGDFLVIRDTRMPATLLEIGYLSNEMDKSSMMDQGFQQRVAQSIVEGIKEYLRMN